MSEYRLIPLHGKRGEGIFAKISPEDFYWARSYKWLLDPKGYVRASSDGRYVFLHRLVKDAPDNKIVDHRNGDRLDNQRGNLRLCSNQENAWNSSSARGMSRFKGVSASKDKKKYVAYIRVNGKRIHLGTYKTEIEAARIYDEAAIANFGEFARPNFP